MSTIYNNRYYYLNKHFLIVIGQWPYQSRLRANVMLAITLFFLFSLTAFEFWGLIAGIKNLNIVMENSSPLLVNSFIIVKLTNCFFNKHKMKKLLDDIEETWKMKQNGPENEILRSYAEKSKIFFKQYAFGLYMMWLFYTTMPIVVNGVYRFLPTNDTYSARFLYRLEHVVDMDKYFNLLMFHGFIRVFYIVAVPIALDTFFMLCVNYVCALFENIRRVSLFFFSKFQTADRLQDDLKKPLKMSNIFIGYNLERIPARTDVLFSSNITDDKNYDIIVYCIKWYKHALNFFELLSSTFATSFLFVLGNTLVCLSFTAAELIVVDVQLDKIIRIIANNVAQLFHLLSLNLTSQLLIDSSNEFQTVIYSCNWYATSVRCRHLLRLTLLRASKPCQIKAGKMYVMSLETFSSILQVSISYFTVLTSMQL
ncbi:LOW QUALITY PROTEIN: odorant receptor 13a-like [Pseudomyrmex gracilis]|uniref:LOW QUALITY PROTEIN: odorant receptor 13a-like n=1 Tax=Pseudomyrmex gracilis TaxID=219809 RepID=UPI000994CE51|nr:LOW QUALITY PROTEIN: odorant receptor 13a-like [Pseudomyrmex gracilis]